MGEAAHGAAGHRQGQPHVLPVHFDSNIDAYKKAEDVMIEAMLMARGCHGLLSTFSNVSASCVYLSPEEKRVPVHDFLGAAGPHAPTRRQPGDRRAVLRRRSPRGRAARRAVPRRRGGAAPIRRRRPSQRNGATASIF
ncbi:unnamed protein product [Prorocentrum cordatum]|uniref:Uncharacterized protein n=1 Tax=Prorocentrum cordatum TaxID=2364126 RepID=A0ABN9X577_9DINO|nr:unnamed protein product [Polarella glacialis]